MKRWYGKVLGVFAGAALLRSNPLLGALIGLLLGHALDNDWFRGKRENPYAVLGLDEEATDAEVDLAYRRLMSQYHPDRVAGAGTDVQRHAEVRAREINAAYDRIQALRKNSNKP
ncbi:Heat shock protein DnaJ domain protein [Lysobacter dokdonensis DS-58]|uniref:Heat shock protein DnaJ domain protein n=1 Tax=Lysobacter dokdonensis DS-58 TaxID=1300345 RepID=A0A0A2WP55_9GAMM|nr:DnaJ domain-containing protein [Lysobacter dokdonensis]KGQ20060.1 Heat shock protein DnaJ domain protein [Lysobacter dokdonensis DS-58]